MTTFALTGGIGTGKSTAAELLTRRGLPVVDTDQLARDLVQPGRPALEEIARTFGADLIGPDGSLRRDELARRVFADDHARHRLEEILHPGIRKAWQDQLAAWTSAGRTQGIVVIPLLFEVRAETEFDVTVCLACTERTQWRRLRTRGWEEAEIRQRLAAQLPLRAKMERSDRVIWNEASLEVLAIQLDRVIDGTNSPRSAAL